MSRNRYTKLVRKSQRSQIVRQEKEMATLAYELNLEATESTAVPFTDGKEHRRARLQQERQHKPEHFRAAVNDGS